MQKTKKDRCPVCQQEINNYKVCNTKTLAESASFPFKETLAIESLKGKSDLNEHGSAYECLDHQYFVAEIAKLIKIRSDIEMDRFHRRISN